MRARTLMLVLGGLLLLLPACLGNDAAANDPTIPAAGPDDKAPRFDWSDRTVTDFGDGWTAVRCEGDGPFMCVERDGEWVGTLEALSYEVGSFDVMDPAADPITNLEAMAEEYYEVIGSDRASFCGADYGFERLGPDEFVLGGQPGVFYGYVGTLADGTPSELNLQYATIVGGQIVGVTAIAYDEGGCPGRDDVSSWDSVTLSEFRTMLENSLHDSPLPSI